MDLFGLISFVGFKKEKYFFTFTNDFTYYTKTYISTKKSN